MDEFNPYEPPNSSDAELQGVGESTRASEKLIYVAWIVVCIFNLPVPLRVAWPMKESSGRIGMSIAVVTLMAGGCWICANARKSGFLVTLSTGSLLMMLSAGCGFLLSRFIPDPWRLGNEGSDVA